MLRLPRATDGRRFGAYGKALLRVSLAACAMLLAGVAACGGSGVSSQSSERAAQSSGELGTLICGTHRVIDQSGKESQEPEYYIVASMNRKLRYYPEFASAIGMKSVGTCEEARSFTVAYGQYFSNHPYFDKDLPWDPEQVRLPEVPPEADTIPKIFNGTPAAPSTSDPFPVVQISIVLKDTKYINGQPVSPGDGTVCSGTFISKHFILTAAHCFQKLALTKSTSLSSSSLWNVAGEWEIRWPDSAGHPVANKTHWAASIVHPAYTGPGDVVRASPDAQATVFTGSYYDIGLLFLYPEEDDGFLAPDADKSSWDIQNENAGHLFAGWTLTDYGYGPTREGSTDPVVLNSFMRDGSGLFNRANPADPNSVNSVVSANHMSAPIVDWAVCRGDSGGPLVRHSALTPSTDVVIVAVNSSFDNQSDSTQQCGSSQFQRNNWARTDVAASFISYIVNSWLNSSKFKVEVDEPNHPASYIKLHGPSCSADCNCGAGAFCSNYSLVPGSNFDQNRPNTTVQTCQPAGPGAVAGCSDCSCIKGQCLPLPAKNLVPPDAGTFACPAPGP